MGGAPKPGARRATTLNPVTDHSSAEPTSRHDPVDPADLEAVEQQLGRPPRGVLAISYRCPDGRPGAVKTAPRLEDGTPFPTLYYLTDPRLTAEASRQESAGLMRGMSERLLADEALAANYRSAHERYLAERNAIEDLGTDFSGGGMPERVKCLHVLMAYALSEGPGVCVLGDESVALAADAGLRGSAVPVDWPTSEELGCAGAADEAQR